MTQTLLCALRLIVGLGVALFSAFSVVATVLIVFAWQASALVWDDNGPCWPFAIIATICLFASLLWLMLWHSLPYQGRLSVKSQSPQRPPLTVVNGTSGPVTAFVNALN